jgi:hypothetical protein
MSAIADAVRWAEEIMKEIDERQGREMGVERALEAYEHPLRTTATCAFKSSNHAAAKASYGFRAALWDARSSALTRRIKS